MKQTTVAAVISTSRAALRRRLLIVLAIVGSIALYAAPEPPELTQPVNDFAHVIDAPSVRAIEQVIRELQSKTGDVIVVATVPNLEPYGEINEYAVKMFENHGRGIGQKGKDNGVLIVLAMAERRVKIEVGYDLEQFVTDGYAGETSRMMTPAFASRRYGEGLRLGVNRVAGRIAQGRGVTLDGVAVPREPVRQPDAGAPASLSVIFWIFIAIIVISRIAGSGSRRRGFWGGGPWSGWSSGVGPFGGGGGWGGGGGGGFGGGFGGFGGGRSGGGGGGASW